MKLFEKGDIVCLTDSGKSYTTYSNFFEFYEIDGSNYKYDVLPQEYKMYEVLACHKHTRFSGEMICVIKNIENNSVFLVEQNGLRIVKYACCKLNDRISLCSTYMNDIICNTCTHKNAIKIGGLIRVINSGRCYSTYTDFFKENNLDSSKYDYNISLRNGDVCKLIDMHLHRRKERGMVCLVEKLDNGKQYLINFNGIKGISRNVCPECYVEELEYIEKYDEIVCPSCGYRIDIKENNYKE